MPDALHFADFEIRPDRRVVLVRGQPAVIGARAFDLLLALAHRRERVVPQGELLEAVWPGLVVEANNLAVHVAALRRALGDGVIATVPGRGYRFTAGPVEAAGPAAREPRAAPAPPGAAAAPAGAASGTRLPAFAAWPLVGREAEIDALAIRVLTERLTSVVGTGGIGKTRLVGAAASRLAPDFPGGVWFADLAPLTTAAQVLPAVAQAVGVGRAAETDAAVLAQALPARASLVVLDNCEHLLEGVARLAAQLLAEAPGVSMLATSQEPLRVPGEQVFRLAPLAVPPAQAADKTSARERPAAVALFELRAAAVQPGFGVNAENAEAIGDIVRRLDGIPLAIELAAARLPLLGVEGLRRRLDDRLRLLTTGPRVAPARQQTLRAAIEWSHALLEPDEQRVLRRLAVFRGGFTLEAATSVAGEPGEDAWAVIDRLGALVEKSLVVAADAGAEVPEVHTAGVRYRLLESTRAFALERLVEAGEADPTARRHAEAMLAAFAGSDWRRYVEGEGPTLARLRPEIDNLRAALDSCRARDDALDLYVALAAASGLAMLKMGLPLEAEARLDDACAVAEARATPAPMQAELLRVAATASQHRSAAKEVQRLERAAALFAASDDVRGRFLALTSLATKHVWRGEPEACAAALDEAERLWQPGWPPRLREALLRPRVYWHEMCGRPEAGEPLALELVALARAVGDETDVTVCLADLAENYAVQGKAEAAVRVREELRQRIDPRRTITATPNLGNLMAAYTALGDVPRALPLARECAAPLARLDRLDTLADHYALLAALRGRFTDAARVLGFSDAELARRGYQREGSEARAAAACRARLAEALPAAAVEQAMREGAVMTAASVIAGSLDGADAPADVAPTASRGAAAAPSTPPPARRA
jgi:predicted ATPase/DNA-binding winged helix-turn-helix (wHTH) protein